MKLKFVPVIGLVWLTLGLLAATPAAAAPEATFTVNTTIFMPNDGDCDAELCTLSEAIEAANVSPGKDKIKFNIPPTRANGCNEGTGVCTLKIEGSLPSIADVTIDGYSQPGATLNTLAVGMNTQIKIVLEGQQDDLINGDIDGLHLGFPGGATIRGLAFTNFVHAIYIQSDNNLIIGNFIGMLPDGVTPHANLFGIRGGGTNNKIGTAIPAQRNLLSGNEGLAVWESFSTRTKIQGNYFGTDKSGLVAIGGGSIQQINPTDLLIGGFEQGQGNVIGGDSFGILLAHYVDTRVINNNIGVGADNKAAIGIGYGITIQGNDNETGRVTILGNRIANSQGSGVDNSSIANNVYLTRNSIYNNGGLGIDWGEEGVTPNDPKDVDDGPNGLQNFPVLTEVTPSPNGTTIKGKLNSTPSKTFRIEFFTNPTCDSSQHGEGKNYLGVHVVQTNANGKVNFTFQSNKVLLAGTKVTATATSAAGNGTPLETSEFSKCKLVQ